MKLTTTLKNFKNNIIGYFSTTKNNGDSSSEGLRVIPFSYLNNKTRLDDFTWDKFVKVEFAFKDFDNLNIRFRCTDFVYDKLSIQFDVKPLPNQSKTLFITTLDSDNLIKLYAFKEDIIDIVDNNSMLEASNYLTDIIKTSLANGLTSFNFIPSGSSNQNTNTDILKALSCIHVYYRTE